MGWILPRRSLMRIGFAMVAALLCLGAAWLAGRAAERTARARIALTAQDDASLRAALLASEVARYRLLPLALASDQGVASALRDPAARPALSGRLEQLAAATGASAFYVTDRAGVTIAASNWRSRASFVGADYSFRRYYRDAVRTGAGVQFGLGTVSRKSGLYLSRRTLDGGVIVVKLDFDGIERQWREAGGITFVENGAGIVLVTSRPDWRFDAVRPVAPLAARHFRDDLQSGVRSLAPLSLDRARDIHVSVPTGIEDWRLTLIVPTSPGLVSIVHSAQAAGAMGALLLVAGMWLIGERVRRQRAAANAAAERATELEAAVAARTIELQREMDERVASERRADALREGLRQANRLATLGQVTASVAHETAQPVAAIRTYAASSERLLERGDTTRLLDNLRAIARLADRVGQVTAELRGFARKGVGLAGTTSLAEAIDGARLILKQRLSKIAVTVPPLPASLLVAVNPIRLEQVIVNVLQNAAEALDGAAAPAIAITLDVTEDRVLLDIADNGPGIPPEIVARLFTPFFTSRPQGLGLGLVIAQDIMVESGGALRLVEAGSGARFQVEMRRA